MYYFISMSKEEDIIKMLNNSQLFTHEVKLEVIQYFGYLNKKQIAWLYQALESEKTILLNFLKWLKNSWDLKYEKIESIKNNILRKKRLELEQLDNIKTEQSIKNLITSLDNI